MHFIEAGILAPKFLFRIRLSPIHQAVSIGWYEIYFVLHFYWSGSDVIQENTSRWSCIISDFVCIPIFSRRSILQQPLLHVFNVDIILVVLQTPIR